ncbi:uncharacterized protein LOC130508636 [Raphanus sativus]|uniref:Uncharacterized protein LOC130508636 n=1 Tax=Raphanus sativus TaxID=3726 RepID=A0A9W3D8Q4_RAPSA|nr:uncharacterized protein LOC130508636 [Raphanus sativus]
MLTIEKYWKTLTRDDPSVNHHQISLTEAPYTNLRDLSPSRRSLSRRSLSLSRGTLDSRIRIVLLEVHRDSLQFSRTQQFNDVTQGLGTLGELGNVGGVLNDGTGTLVFNHGTQGDIQGLENQTRGLDRHQRNQLEEVLPEVHRDSLQFSQNQQFNVHTQGLGTLGGLGNVGGVLNDGTGTGTGTLVFNHGTQGDTQDQQFNDVTLGLGNQTRGLGRQQRNQPEVLPEVHRDSLQFSHDDDLYVFNDLGNLGELGNLQGVFNNNDSTLVDDHGSLVFHDDVTLVFDNEGNLVDTLVFNDDGTLVDPFVFNDDGTLVDPLVFEEDGTLALNNDGTQGVVTQGVTQGDGTQGNGTQGDGIQGDGTQGDGTQGVFKDGFHLRSLYGQGDEDI